MKNDSDTTVQELKDLVRDFIHERDWEKYHNPKDIAESICIEAAELLELFQWVNAEEASTWLNSPSKFEKIEEELADVLVYCLSMANTMKIDVRNAVVNKIIRNEAKYPTEKYRGRAHLDRGK